MDQFTASGAAFFSVKPGHGVATRLGFAKTKFGESDISKDKGDAVMGCRIGGESLEFEWDS